MYIFEQFVVDDVVAAVVFRLNVQKNKDHAPTTIFTVYVNHGKSQLTWVPARTGLRIVSKDYPRIQKSSRKVKQILYVSSTNAIVGNENES